MNYTKKMTAVLSVVMLFSSFSASAVSMPDWRNWNWASIGWSATQFTGLGMLLLQYRYLLSRVHKLEQQEATTHSEVAKCLVSNETFIGSTASSVSAQLSKNDQFVKSLAGRIHQPVYTVEALEEVMVGLSLTRAFEQTFQREALNSVVIGDRQYAQQQRVEQNKKAGF